MATKIYLSKAQGPPDIPDMHIEIVAPASDFESLKEYAMFYEDEAEKLFRALVSSLPGGTIDRFLAKMLRYKASHFVIPFERWQEEIDVSRIP